MYEYTDTRIAITSYTFSYARRILYEYLYVT